MYGVEGEPARKLAIGVVAVLARSHNPRGNDYIREIYEKFPDRRGHIAMALTQNPDNENWALLVQSLPVLDGAFAQQVFEQGKGNFDDAVNLAFQSAYSRQPNPQELDIAKKSIAEDSDPKEGLRLFLQAMMGANDFLYSY
jgi:hypothetical protein